MAAEIYSLQHFYEKPIPIPLLFSEGAHTRDGHPFCLGDRRRHQSYLGTRPTDVGSLEVEQRGGGENSPSRTAAAAGLITKEGRKAERWRELEKGREWKRMAPERESEEVHGNNAP